MINNWVVYNPLLGLSGRFYCGPSYDCGPTLTINHRLAHGCACDWDQNCRHPNELNSWNLKQIMRPGRQGRPVSVSRIDLEMRERSSSTCNPVPGDRNGPKIVPFSSWWIMDLIADAHESNGPWASQSNLIRSGLFAYQVRF